MAHYLCETEYNPSKEINGYVFHKIDKYVKYSSSSFNLTIEIDLFNAQNDIIETKLFSGPLDSTTSNIKQIFEKDVDIVLIEHNRKQILKDFEKPLFKCCEVYNGFLRLNCHVFLRASLKPLKLHVSRPFLFHSGVSQLRKLIVINFPINKIELENLRFLRYLKLINNGLKSIKYSKKYSNRILEFCDLRNNLLKQCHLRAKTLILQKNRIPLFSSLYKFRYLNLSQNPLKRLSCSTDFLNIKHTLCDHFLSCDAKVIIADGVSNFKIGSCPNLTVLFVNDCHLIGLSHTMTNLTILKAKNNYFQELPRLNKCTVLDVSGNFLEKVKSKNAIFLNISKNQIREFDFTKFQSLKHLNISFNPVESIVRKKETVIPSTVIMNTSMPIRKAIEPRKMLIKKNSIKMKKHAMHYKLEIRIDKVPISIYVLLLSSKKEDYTSYLSQCLDKFKSMHTLLDLFSGFSEYCYRKLSSADIEGSMSFTLITNRFVMLRSFYLPIFYSNFSQIDVLDNPKTIKVFNNVSHWYVFPIFQTHEFLANKRCYSFFSSAALLEELFQFTEVFSAKTLEFLISNCADFYSFLKPLTSSSCSLIKYVNMKEYKGDFRKVLEKTVINQIETRINTLGFINFNFGINNFEIENTNRHASPISPVFLFMKLVFPTKTNRIIQIEELNLIHLIEMYCKIFGGDIVEKNYAAFIVGFGTSLQAALFALRLQNALQTVDIDVCVGISNDLVFRTEQDGVSYFGGPAFNKTARMSDLGAGVFICNCVKIFSPLIEIIDEGDRHLKGFDSKHKIHLLKLAISPSGYI